MQKKIIFSGAYCAILVYSRHADCIALRKGKHVIHRHMENVRHRKGNASVYDGFIGSRVIVYYRDMRGTDRKLHGVLSSVEGDHLHLENGEWRGALNCGTARVLLVSTVTGWNSSGGEQQDAREQEEPSRLRVLIGKMFRI